MIITCPRCDKKFEVDATLIPKEGRLVQCGYCHYKWHFKNETNLEKKDQNPEFIDNNNYNQNFDRNEILFDNKEYINKNNNNINIKKTTTNKKSNISLSFILRLLLVSIISFIAILIVLDTFKSTITIMFPGLEIILQNLNETLKDIFLFFKDLVI